MYNIVKFPRVCLKGSSFVGQSIKGQRNNGVPLKKSALGLALVELMIAITIGSILSAGVIQIFISNKDAYKLNEEYSLLQENGRRTLSRLGYSIMMADHWGIMSTFDVGTKMLAAATVKTAITGIGNCNGNWILETGTSNGDVLVTGVRGYEGELTLGNVVTNSSLPSGCLVDSEYVANSDIVVLRYADAGQVVAKANLASTSEPNYADMVFIRGGVNNINKVIFPFTEVTLGGSVADLGTLDVDGVYNYPYSVELYYLRTCTNKDPITGCLDSKPALVHLRLSSETANAPEFIEEVVAENIEQLQFLYGVDLNNDGSLDKYSNAKSVADWAQVISVSVSFISRTGQESTGFTDNKIYTMLDYKHTLTGKNNKYHRKLYEKNIQIRNRVRS